MTETIFCNADICTENLPSLPCLSTKMIGHLPFRVDNYYPGLELFLDLPELKVLLGEKRGENKSW